MHSLQYNLNQNTSNEVSKKRKTKKLQDLLKYANMTKEEIRNLKKERDKESYGISTRRNLRRRGKKWLLSSATTMLGTASLSAPIMKQRRSIHSFNQLARAYRDSNQRKRELVSSALTTKRDCTL